MSGYSKRKNTDVLWYGQFTPDDHNDVCELTKRRNQNIQKNFKDYVRDIREKKYTEDTEKGGFDVRVC